MPYAEKLTQIESLRNIIDQYGPISNDLLKKINYKFRLEWNYTSNSMEGNSLTKQETRSVMVGNITVGGKPMKDILEMKGHDDLISDILKMSKGELNISEKRIKEIHKAIVHEDDPAKQKMIGKWKLDPNYLYNYKQERFDFVAPGDVEDAMHQLINWLNGEKDKISRQANDAMHPVTLAFEFHLKYITVHPFHDGNGRTARILTNIILIAYGLPPIYITETEKKLYYQYLADIQGYGGEPDLFYDFMADRLIRSMELVIDAIEGRTIEEPDDLKKKLSLLKKQLGQDPNSRVEIRYSNDAVANAIKKSIIPLTEIWENKLRNFDALFKSREIRVSASNLTRKGIEANKTLNDFCQGMLTSIMKSAVKVTDVRIRCNFKNLRTIDKELNINGGEINVQFHDHLYEIIYSGANQSITKLYDQFLTEAEIESITDSIGNWAFNEIEEIVAREK
ncbi:Fic family protein [Taibaiella soli]|uniref:Fido domain-containing protein n=1 Tax=Taibaiella soli TaxID=1649169 RepID=A0A2W2AKG5_9BACT|nr:Fic family protein [Taibaiella soli]PZF72750.1 hypothetical protein DN068_12895 [Taibaiella soli]